MSHTKHRLKLIGLLVIGIGANLSVGCIIGTQAEAEVAFDSPEPRVVMVAPGLWVVEGHRHAVFYEDGYYYRQSGGIWYRSSYYDDGFVRVHARLVPRRIFTVQRPSRYARYRGRRNARYQRTRARRRAQRIDRRQRHERRERRHERRHDRRDHR